MARVEGKTFICTKEKYEAVPHVGEGVEGHLAKWLSLDQLNTELGTRLPGAMKGRLMYVIPFSMGPLTSPLSKYCIELTDSPYVMINMLIMTRVTTDVFAAIEKANGEFVRAVHTVGCPEYVTISVTVGAGAGAALPRCSLSSLSTCVALLSSTSSWRTNEMFVCLFVQAGDA